MAKPLYDLQPGDTAGDFEADLQFLALYEPGLPQRLDAATHRRCFEAALQAVEAFAKKTMCGPVDAQ